MKKTMLTMSLMMLSLAGLANERGNGGNVGVCFDSKTVLQEIRANGNRISKTHLNKITTVKALEIYEAEAKYYGRDLESELILPNDEEKPFDFVERIIKRYDRTIPEVAKVLRFHKNEFKEENILNYTEAGLDRIHDTGEAYYLDPDKCVIATVIRQSKEGDKPVLEIDRRLLDHVNHDPKSRGLLYLHETVLRWAIEIRDRKPVHLMTTNTRKVVLGLIKKRITSDVVVKLLVSNEFAERNRYGDISFVVAASIDANRLLGITYSPNSYFDNMMFVIDDKTFDGHFSDEFWKQSRGVYHYAAVVRKYGSYISIVKHMRKCEGMEGCFLKDDEYRMKAVYEEIQTHLSYIKNTRQQTEILEEQIKQLEEKLARAVFGKGKIREEIKAAKSILASYKKSIVEWENKVAQLTAERAAAAQRFAAFTKKYLPEVDRLKGEFLSKLKEKSSQAKVKLSQQDWLTQENKGKILKALDENIKLWETEEEASSGQGQPSNMTRTGDEKIEIPEF